MKGMCWWSLASWDDTFNMKLLYVYADTMGNLLVIDDVRSRDPTYPALADIVIAKEGWVSTGTRLTLTIKYFFDF